MPEATSNLDRLLYDVLAEHPGSTAAEVLEHIEHACCATYLSRRLHLLLERGCVDRYHAGFWRWVVVVGARP